MANRSVTYTSDCHIDCRHYITTQNYQTTKTHGRVRLFLAGFEVNNFASGSEDYFGLDLTPIITTNWGTSTSFSFNLTVYGRSQLDELWYYYVAWEHSVANLVNYREVTDGRESLGCYYHRDGCGSLSNTTFKTDHLGTMTNLESTVMIGLDRMIMKWPGSSSVRGTFDLTALSQGSDTKMSGTFAFTGNTDLKFHAVYSFFTLQSFYCPSSAAAKYYALNSDSCQTHCNNWIEQYADASNFCRLCGDKCYKCENSADYCLECYSVQNRVSNGSGGCLFDQARGYYDDGSSLVCPSCHYSCDTCSAGGATHCLSCLASSHRALANNSCPCVDGYYDWNSSVCVGCHYTCSGGTCSSYTSNRCLSCNTSAHRTWHSNLTCGCAARHYDGGSNIEECAPCHYSCLSAGAATLHALAVMAPITATSALRIAVVSVRMATTTMGWLNHALPVTPPVKHAMAPLPPTVSPAPLSVTAPFLGVSAPAGFGNMTMPSSSASPAITPVSSATSVQPPIAPPAAWPITACSTPPRGSATATLVMLMLGFRYVRLVPRLVSPVPSAAHPVPAVIRRLPATLLECNASVAAATSTCLPMAPALSVTSPVSPVRGQLALTVPHAPPTGWLAAPVASARQALMTVVSACANLALPPVPNAQEASPLAALSVSPLISVPSATPQAGPVCARGATMI